MSVHEYFEVDYWDYENICYEFLRNRNFYLKIKKFIDFEIYDEVCHSKTEEDQLNAYFKQIFQAKKSFAKIWKSFQSTWFCFDEF